jgi:hypothetical protein
MKHWMSLALALTFLPNVWANPISDDAYEEVLYHDFQSRILSKELRSYKIHGITNKDQALFVDALWDLIDEDNNPAALDALDELNTFYYQVVDRLRVEILRLKYKRSLNLPQDLLEELRSNLLNPIAERRLIYTIAAYEEVILEAGHDDIIELAQNHKAYFDIAEDEVAKKEITNNVVGDLFHETPDTTTYMNGEYVVSVKIFMFCRENRIYPCLMVMKDVHGQPVRNADGSLWTHPSLASSARGLPSYVRNGNTPAGILTIDSVMPAADQQISFGKFRRMIVNFVPKSKNESLMRSLIPESSQNLEWWKPAIVSRDVGRNLLRIHGTGKTNVDPTTPYYPFMRTSGCIAQRENTYDGITFKDQRVLLDEVMKAMDLTPNYANEVKVKGILYIMDLDDESSAVSANDLAKKGIE